MTTMIKVDTTTRQVIINDGGHQHSIDLVEILGGVSLFMDERKVYEDYSTWTRLRAKESMEDAE